MNTQIYCSFAALFFTFSLLAINDDHQQILGSIKKELRALEELKILNDNDIDIAAEQIYNSGLPFEAVKVRLVRYITNKDTPFDALEKALILEERSLFKKRMIAEVRGNPSSFMTELYALNLSANQSEKVLRAYAVCAYPLTNIEYRDKLRPKISQDPINHFIHPRSQKNSSVKYRQKASKKDNQEKRAYSLLIRESEKIAREYKLDDFEIIAMAKCMAEQTLRFFKPIDHPAQALKESSKISYRSPESAFFAKQGVCSNFCVITCNIAQGLGVRAPMFIVERKLHAYIEIKADDGWYHTHPFASDGIDFTRFGD